MTERVSFNKSHPELKEGEVFIGNISLGYHPHLDIVDPDWSDYRTDWEVIGWKTKRRGNVAYDIYGKPINGMCPVFAQKSELEEAGVNPNRLS